MSKKIQEGRPVIYENSLKIAVAREYLTSQLSYGNLAAKYNLRLDTIRHFVKWYKARYPDGDDQRPIESIAGSSPGINKDQELDKAHLKIAGLEMLIETAQKELGIDIVKKYGTKQSTK